MTPEGYVGSIVKKIKSTKARKKEIEKQLLSDIRIQLDQGKALEEVIKETGKADEVASEFNDQLTAEEKKKFQRGKILRIAGGALAVLCLAVVLIYWYLPKTYPIGREGIFEWETVEKQAKEVIDRLNEGDYEALKANATKQMTPFLEADYFERARSQICDDWGAFERFSTVYVYGVQQMNACYAYVEISARYENTDLTYTVILDEDLRVAGIYIK